MAGAGYKLFNTGDVLTAAQVNNYLQEQTVMVFANSTARTTALSGVLAEGMVSYLQDTNAVEVYNGTSWVGVSGSGDVTEVQAGVGISVTNGTGPIPIVTNSSTDLITTAGDLLYGTAADTVARLGIGTAGQVLQVNSGATAPQWATVGADQNWSLVNTPSGTSLTGANTITVSGITGANNLYLVVSNISSVSASSAFSWRFNSDTAANYDSVGQQLTAAAAYATSFLGNTNFQSQTSIPIGTMGNNAADAVSTGLRVSGGNTAGLKQFISVSGATGSGQIGRTHMGFWNNTATISSVSIISSSGNFDGGQLYVYKSA